jgi:hypothetical protein
MKIAPLAICWPSEILVTTLGIRGASIIAESPPPAARHLREKPWIPLPNWPLFLARKA